MRRNTMGEFYCHSAAELYQFLDEREILVCDINADQIDPPDEGTGKAACEIRSNESGDTVCFVEAETVAAVKAILDQAHIEQ